jgi:multicomponent Na+:H+ antiporter subunit E
LRAFLAPAILLFALWLLLTGSFDPQELAVGAIAALLVAALVFRFTRSLTGGGARFLKRVAFALAYVPYLLWQIILANIDVARRVASPRLPISPGIVRVRTNLRSPLGRLILTSSITLTPGTLTVETDGGDLFIHWIDVTADGIEESTRRIVSGFERYLEVIFG